MTTTRARIWDFPVRLTHWSFAVLVPALYLTAKNSLWWWHTRLGVLLLALLVFRLLWGVIGTRTARFASFVKGPGAVLEYLKGNSAPATGHSPLGAMSVLALLAAMAAQVGMGLFAGDPYDGATGPLNALVGVMTADWLTETHEWFYWVVFALVALHLAAIAFYSFVKRSGLVGPMVTGSGVLAGGQEPNSTASGGRIAIAFALSFALAGWVWLGAPPLS